MHDTRYVWAVPTQHSVPTPENTIRHADDLAAIARRGGAVSAGARLLIVRCSDCAATFLYDERADRLYPDPADLTHMIDDAADPERATACPCCARADWSFEDVLAHHIDEVLDGPWSFCFWQPPRARPPRSRLVRIGTSVALGTLALLGAAALVLNPDPLAPPDAGIKRMHEVGR